ncbi:alpha/beta fold hydrolase [Acinetobacter puyangensis]|uniref:alpha/beta fold hydrolase n=1 Tax=Acinetobacter puyangensis TaxID=1096779 RepID=UPI003A4E3389
MNSIAKDRAKQSIEINPTDFFELYHRDVFKQPVREFWLDGWKVEYMAIAQSETIHKTPIVIVGGAFQNFNSYKYCVEQLFQCGPVILIDLPSMGANQQIYNKDSGASAAILELPDLSHMLGIWLDAMGIRKVSMMGMSLGSVVASHFADQRPELVERMVLMGVMQKTRPSWRMILEESLKLMQEGRMQEFGQAVILYLVNHAKLDQTRMSPTAKRLFFQQMSEFTTTEQLRYEINCNRLLRLHSVPAPSCKVLVAAGQYDSFTLPFENAHFALQCPDMEFALIAGADHVPQLQRRKETMNLFSTFLRGDPIQHLEGIIPMSRAQMHLMERRGEERIKVKQPHTYMSYRHSDLTANVDIININFFGVLLEIKDVDKTQQVARYARDMSLSLTDEQGEFSIECLIFELKAHQLRILFKHGSFELAERLLRYIAAQKQAIEQTKRSV